jgi:hypothetical protein
MSGGKPETRCKHLAREIEPLAAFLARERPHCSTISIRRADWTMLLAEPVIARSHGFVVDEGSPPQGALVRYQGFELRPTDCAPVNPPDTPEVV